MINKNAMKQKRVHKLCKSERIPPLPPPLAHPKNLYEALEEMETTISRKGTLKKLPEITGRNP